jgi:hypothetical protein
VDYNWVKNTFFPTSTIGSMMAIKSLARFFKGAPRTFRPEAAHTRHS